MMMRHPFIAQLCIESWSLYVFRIINDAATYHSILIKRGEFLGRDIEH